MSTLPLVEGEVTRGNDVAGSNYYYSYHLLRSNSGSPIIEYLMIEPSSLNLGEALTGLYV